MFVDRGIRLQCCAYQTDDLRHVYGFNFAYYGCLRHRKRQYATIYNRYRNRHGNSNSINSEILSAQHYTHQELY